MSKAGHDGLKKEEDNRLKMHENGPRPSFGLMRRFQEHKETYRSPRALRPNSLVNQRIGFRSERKISRPNDPSELEANSTAESIMRLEGTFPVHKSQPISKSREISHSTKAPPETGQNSEGSDGGIPLSNAERRFFEPRFNANFSHVRIHNDARAHTAANSINADAFTNGNDIFIANNQYRPETSTGKKLIAHELAHVLQRNSTINRKSNKNEIEDDFAELGVWVDCYFRTSPDGDRMTDRLHKIGDTVRLIGQNNHWIHVQSEDGSRGWVKKSWTSFSQHSDPSVENLKCRQDIDEFRNRYLEVAFEKWNNCLAIQGEAYRNAFKSFHDILKDAQKEAKLQMDIFAAVLTTVSVGTLGFIGELASKGMSWASILKSNTFRGSLEDAIQAGVGETIDIAQGNWGSGYVNSDIHPETYKISQQEQLRNVKLDLEKNLTNIQSDIRMSPHMADRAAVMLKMFQWWNGAKLKYTPKITQNEQKRFQREIEREFWRHYILNHLSKGVYYLFWGPGYEYGNPESIIKTRFDQLGISRDAGIEEWESWYERLGDSGREADGKKYYGPDDTQKLSVWARTGERKRFD